MLLFKDSFKFVSQLARKSDVDLHRGQLQRYSLFSRKTVWLCVEHGKFSRGMLTDDVTDFEDVFVSGEIVSVENKTNQVMIKIVARVIKINNKINFSQQHCHKKKNSQLKI